MKKNIIKIMSILVLTFTLSIANAQSDNYFFNWNDYRAGGEDDPTAPLIPQDHGTNSDQAAPLGGGLLLLAGMGVAYCLKKRRDESF